MTTSDTPRTDAVLMAVRGGMCPDGTDGVTESEDANAKLEALCRQLERENNALRERLADVEQALNLWKGLAELSDVQKKSTADGVRLLVEQLAERDAALAVCTNALALYANGKDIYQDERIADYAAEVLANLPESAKQAAKVLEAAVELMEATDECESRLLAPVYDSGAYADSSAAEGTAFDNLRQAVRGMKGAARSVR